MKPFEILCGKTYLLGNRISNILYFKIISCLFFCRQHSILELWNAILCRDL